jgi:hypothetical protein
MSILQAKQTTTKTVVANLNQLQKLTNCKDLQICSGKIEFQSVAKLNWQCFLLHRLHVDLSSATEALPRPVKGTTHSL